MTTAIYPNRQEDKLILEERLNLKEDGISNIEFHIPFGPLFAKGYSRIVYRDHGPYIEFSENQIKIELLSKFGNKINSLPEPSSSKFYYFWLYPKVF
jgi:hypothetical protein